MTLEEIKIKSEQEWNKFKEKVEKKCIPEIENKNNILIDEINKLKNIVEIIKSNSLTVEKLLEISDVLIKFDNSLETNINYLKIFKEENLLDNVSTEDLFNSTKEKIDITKISDSISSSEEKLEHSKKIIKEINELINGEKFEFDLINEMCDSLQIEETSKRLLLMHPICSVVLNKNIEDKKETTVVEKTEDKPKATVIEKTEEKQNTTTEEKQEQTITEEKQKETVIEKQEQTAPEENKEKTTEKIKEPKQVEKKIEEQANDKDETKEAIVQKVIDDDVDEKVYESMNEYLEILKVIQEKQNNIVEKYLPVLQKYKTKYESLTEKEHKFYKDYIETLRKEKKDVAETFESDRETLALIYFIQYMECRKEIDKENQIPLNPNLEELEDTNKMNEFMDRAKLIDLFLDDMENICFNLYKTNSIIENIEEQKECKAFILNNDGQTYIDSRIFSEKKNARIFHSILKNGDKGTIQITKSNKELKIDQEKDKQAYLESIEDIGVKNIKTLTNSDQTVTVSYAIINNDTSAVELQDKPIIIIYATTEGIDDLEDKTYKLITDESVRTVIKNQIQLIQKNDNEEMQRQVEIKSMLNIKKKNDDKRRV